MSKNRLIGGYVSESSFSICCLGVALTRVRGMMTASACVRGGLGGGTIVIVRCEICRYWVRISFFGCETWEEEGKVLAKGEECLLVVLG